MEGSKEPVSHQWSSWDPTREATAAFGDRMGWTPETPTDTSPSHPLMPWWPPGSWQDLGYLYSYTQTSCHTAQAIGCLPHIQKRSQKM